MKNSTRFVGTAIAISIMVFGWVVFSLVRLSTRNQVSPDVDHLFGILKELEVFNGVYDRLPHAIEKDADGNVMHSWRFITCRMLFGDAVQRGFYGQNTKSAYSEPWNSSGNKRYYDGPHRNYRGSPTSFIDPTRPGQRTQFLAITGPGTAFDDQTDINLNDVPSDTILVVEIRNSDQHWMEPGGDFHVETMPQYIDTEFGKGISGHDPDGFLVGFASGEIWRISHDVPFETLAMFFTMASAETHSKEEWLGPYRLSAR